MTNSIHDYFQTQRTNFLSNHIVQFERDSVYFFPRYVSMLFVCLHIYIYSTPYGFTRVALIPYGMLTLHAMIFTVLSMEVSAASKGAVSNECPREVYVKLGWSDWSASLPPEWTIFHPLNARYIPLHDRNLEDEENDNE